MTVLPRHVVCFLGRWTSLDPVAEIVHGVAGADFFHNPYGYWTLTEPV